VRAILRSGNPYIFYLHPWEIDPGQPRVDGLNAIARFRHGVNLDRCEERFASLVGAFEWMPLGELIDSWIATHPSAAATVLDGEMPAAAAAIH
jgi:hypothetical protein